MVRDAPGRQSARGRSEPWRPAAHRVTLEIRLVSQLLELWTIMEFRRIVRSLPVIVSALSLAHGLGGQDSAAQDQPPALRVDHSAVNANVGGLHLCVPEKWSVLDLVVTNPLKEPREILSATYFDGAPTLQYGRRVWVPAQARLTTWLPVLLPKLPSPAGSSPQFDIHSVVVDPNQSQEVLHREDTGGRLHSGILPARFDRPITGYMGPTNHVAGQTDPAYELVIAGRSSQRQSRQLTFFDPQSRIPDDFALQGVDQLVISDDTIHEDPVRLAAIRRWLHAGGLLWVMLDQADPQVLERIAGDRFRCSMIDRVGLTTVHIDSKQRGGQITAFEFELEQPVDLVRVVLAHDDFQVGHTVNGWPAAFTKSFGAGEILVTTLGARGWMRLRQPQDSQSDGRRDSQGRLSVPDLKHGAPTPFVVHPPMKDIATSFFLVPTAPRSSIADALEAQAGEYIGTSIPPRWQITGLLLGFGGAIVVLGFWLRSKGALEHLGWSGPALSIVAAVVLLVIGGLKRHAIPETVAVVDFVQPIAGTDDIRSQGTAMFYRPEAGRWEIETARGGRLTPDMTGQEGTTRRLVWSDLDAWSWQNLTQTAPQSVARFDQAQTLTPRIEARATFDADGLAGRIATPSAMTPADAIMATRSGQLGVALLADGAIRVAADGVLGRDQYLDAGILSDEQDRRRRTNKLVLQHLRRDDWRGPPLLMLWTDDRISNFQFDAERRSLGAALVAIPLVLERPAPGTTVRIPSPFLDYRETFQPNGEPSSPLWDHSRREWHEYSSAALVWLKFELPPVLLPLALTGGRLEIQVTGPLGQLEIFGLHREPDDHRPGTVGGQAVSIHRWDQPVGKLSLPLTDLSLLKVGSDGGLALGFAVKGPGPIPQADADSMFAEKPSYWQIEELSLELTGKVIERN